MTDADYQAFVSEFERLHAALAGFRAKPDEARAKADAYFHALKHFPLSEVTAKADAWLQREAKMPKPVEWASVRITHGPVVPELSPADTREYLRAEALHYEDIPCACPSCVDAGAQEKPLRFVPEFTREGYDDRARIGDRIVTRGHWAHGHELARWYTSRADFWNRYYEVLSGRGTVSAPFMEGPPRHARTASDLAPLGKAS